MSEPTVVLCILDGVGRGRLDRGDAVARAHTPTFDRLLASHPWCLLSAHGTAVGMPSDGDMGNSEVGHNAMGAGRVFAQGAALVKDAVRTGAIWKAQAWRDAIDAAHDGGTLHLLGLLSDGNVHSHVDHLIAMIRRARVDGVRRLRVHALTDGRDVPGRSALAYLAPLELLLAEGDDDFAVATGGGRMRITMDRYEADWSMVERGWRCHVGGEGARFTSATAAVQALYDADPSRDDQWLPPFVVGDYTGMRDGDAVILFNFRGDRALEISRAFDGGDDFDAFERRPLPRLSFAGMMEYDGDLHVPSSYLVAPPVIEQTVSSYLSAANLRCLAVSETQKFGHVTYFFNGNRSDPPAGEDRVQIPSDNVPFNQAPAMKAQAITDVVCAALAQGHHHLIRMNLANGDMVGHTGDMSAAISAMETLDACLAQLVDAARDAGAVLLVTADHGNVEEMFQWDKKRADFKRSAAGTPEPSTAHSLNPVPFVLVDPTGSWALDGRPDTIAGGLASIGGTLLRLCGLPVPDGYLPALVTRR